MPKSFLDARQNLLKVGWREKNLNAKEDKQCNHQQLQNISVERGPIEHQTLLNFNLLKIWSFSLPKGVRLFM